jgi:hypothetical protein
LLLLSDSIVTRIPPFVVSGGILMPSLDRPFIVFSEYWSLLTGDRGPQNDTFTF